MRRLWCGIVAAGLILSVAVYGDEKPKPLHIEGKKSLFLRVIARPFSNIYQEKTTESPVVQSNVPALKPFFVYAAPTSEEKELEEGWYRVGTNTRGKVLGWMQAKDVLEWKQTMCLVYTHPEGRAPVLMFETKDDVETLMKLPDEERRKRVEAYYKALKDGNVTGNFPVVSVEPRRAVDIRKEFYFLPILDFEAVEFGDREARVVRLTATTNARPDARETSDVRKNNTYLENATVGRTEVGKKALKDLKVDIVWVVDTTVSMRPYIQKTLEVVESASRKIAESKEADVSMRFGIWGYRDNVKAIPKIGYTTKNYTPDLLPVSKFVEVLKNVKVTPVDSVDYPEDMFSGVNDALNETAWTEGAMRFVILVGDAPAHEPGHKWNLSGQSAETLRVLANDKNIYLYAIHIYNKKAKRFEERALEQYQTLASNKGTSTPAFSEVDSKDGEGFKKITDEVAMLFVDNIKALKSMATNREKAEPGQKSKEIHTASGNVTETKRGGELDFADEGEKVAVEEILGENNESVVASKKNSEAKQLARAMFKAALVEWIGSRTDAKPPRDIVAWAVDKDLLNPDIPSMDVRLLINKRQLDSLATVLDAIIKAGIEGQISGEDFFTSLQATTAMISRDPNMVKHAKRMADTGLVPEFLTGLPYKSELMAIDNEIWESWSADEQMEFIDSLSSKVEAYRKIHDSPEGWIQLNPDDEPDEYVYPVSLDLLP